MQVPLPPRRDPTHSLAGACGSRGPTNKTCPPSVRRSSCARALCEAEAAGLCPALAGPGGGAPRGPTQAVWTGRRGGMDSAAGPATGWCVFTKARGEGSEVVPPVWSPRVPAAWPEGGWRHLRSLSIPAIWKLLSFQDPASKPGHGGQCPSPPCSQSGTWSSSWHHRPCARAAHSPRLPRPQPAHLSNGCRGCASLGGCPES